VTHIFGTLVHLTLYLGQVRRRRSQVNVQGRGSLLSDCWDGRSCLQSRPELETV